MGDSSILQQPKPKMPTFKKKFRHYFKEYCNATGFHGFTYLPGSRSLFEKVFWICAILFSISLCVVYIKDAYVKWEQSPVIVTFANKEMPIHEIPFPSITICSESKLKANVTNLKEIFEKNKSGTNLTEKEMNYLGYLGPMCPEIFPIDFDISQEEEDEDKPARSFDNIFEIMEEVSPRFEFQDCKLLGMPVDCEDMFIPIITDEGLCYTYNFLNRSDIYKDNVVHYANYHFITASRDYVSEWNTERGYAKKAGVDAYPDRALLAGARYDFAFNVKMRNEDVDKFCRQSVEGFRVLFHTPIQIPRLSMQYIRVPFDKTVMAAIEPKMIITSESVKNYSPQKRMCFFPNEKFLKFFEFYSVNNCALECMTNYTLHWCKCVSFYMPRENGTRICRDKDEYCVKLAEYNLHIVKWAKNIKYLEDQEIIKNMSKEENEIVSHCDCLPMCTDIKYRVSVSQADWDWKEDILLRNGENSSEVNETITDYRLTKFSAYFISNTFIASERNELYGLADLLANFGGLIGLFTGFSVLSLLEIVYFLSVRLICNVRMYNNWAGLPPT